MEPEEKNPSGALIGSIIIIVILLIGAIYIWQNEIKDLKQKNSPPIKNTTSTDNITTNIIE